MLWNVRPTLPDGKVVPWLMNRVDFKCYSYNYELTQE